MTATEPLTAFVFRYLVPGVIGTILVALGALGVGWLPLQTSLGEFPVVDAMRSTGIGAVVAKSAVVLGIAFLLQSWLVLGYDVLHGRVRELNRLWLTLAAWIAPLLLAPPLFSRDVYSYFAQGKLMVAGIDPYTHGSSSVPGWFNDGVDPLWAETPTPYGQFFLLIARGVAQFSGPHPYPAALMFRLVAVLGVALLAWGVPRLAFACGIAPAKALWLGVLNPLVLMHLVAGAHNDALMIGLIVFGLALVVEHRPLAGVAMVALGASVKPIALLALPFAGLLWAGPSATVRRRVIRWAEVGGLAIGILLVLALVTDTGLGWISALGTPGAVRTWLSPPTAVGMVVGFALRLVGIDQFDAIIAVLRVLGTVAGVAIVGWLCLKPEGRSAVRGAALAFLAVVLLGPVVQPWYLLWILPLFAVSGLPRWELKVALIGTAALTLHGLATSSATSDSLLEVSDGIAVLAVALLIAVLIVASPRERRLLLGDPNDEGLVPDDPPARARARMLEIHRPAPAPGGG